jgi:[protein-PII] uridylyltransferase
MDTPVNQSVVNIRQSIRSKSTEIFIYTQDIQHVFSRVVGILSSMNLDILYADIYTTSSNQTLDTFIIQDSNGSPLSEVSDIEMIRNNLMKALESKESPKINISQRMPRQLKSFRFPTQVNYTQDILNHRTIMEIISIDRPALLYTISKLIAEVGLQVSHAKIATLGEKIEDIFYLTDDKHRAVRDTELLKELETRIINALDHEESSEPVELTI